MAMLPKELLPLASTIEHLSPRYGNTVTIALRRDNFDDIGRFVNDFEKREFGQSIRQLEHYHVYMVDKKSIDEKGKGSYNYTDTHSIHFDYTYSLILFADFGEPNNKHTVSPLAVCSFEIGYFSDPHYLGYTYQMIKIGQIQTAKFKTQAEHDHYLGFIRYKDVFVHTLEQLTLMMSRSIPHLHATSLPVFSLAENDKTNRLWRKYPEKIWEEAKEMVKNERTKWNQEHGYVEAGTFYNPTVDNVPYQSPYSDVSIKLVKSIVPDKRLTGIIDSLLAQ